MRVFTLQGGEPKKRSGGFVRNRTKDKAAKRDLLATVQTGRLKI